MTTGEQLAVLTLARVFAVQPKAASLLLALYAAPRPVTAPALRRQVDTTDCALRSHLSHIRAAVGGIVTSEDPLAYRLSPTARAEITGALAEMYAEVEAFLRPMVGRVAA